jgi:hypothetical protein
MKNWRIPAYGALIALLCIWGCGGGGGGNGDTTGGTTGGQDRLGLQEAAASVGRMMRTPFAYAALSPLHSRSIRSGAKYWWVVERKRNRTRDTFEGFDPALGLFYVYTDVSETESRLDFFSDIAHQNGVGHIEFTFQSDPSTFPIDVLALYDVEAGTMPVFGDEIIVFESELQASYDAVLTNGLGEGLSYFYEYIENLNNNSVGLSGQFTITDRHDVTWDGEVTSFSDDTISLKLTSDATTNPVSGTVQLAADLSGSANLFRGSTTPVATVTWTSVGAGTITFSDGAQVTFDVNTFVG